MKEPPPEAVPARQPLTAALFAGRDLPGDEPAAIERLNRLALIDEP